MNCYARSESKKNKNKNVINEKGMVELEKAKTDANNYFKNAKFEQALKSFECAIRMDPTNEALLYNKGLCLLNLGRNHEAIQSFDQALRLNALLEWLFYF